MWAIWNKDLPGDSVLTTTAASHHPVGLLPSRGGPSLKPCGVSCHSSIPRGAELSACAAITNVKRNMSSVNRKDSMTSCGTNPLTSSFLPSNPAISPGPVHFLCPTPSHTPPSTHSPPFNTSPSPSQQLQALLLQPSCSPTSLLTKHPPSTFELILICNLIGVVLGLFGLAGGLYLTVVCHIPPFVLFNGRTCSLQQIVGGPVGVAIGLFACLLSTGFIYSARQKDGADATS